MIMKGPLPNDNAAKGLESCCGMYWPFGDIVELDEILPSALGSPPVTIEVL